MELPVKQHSESRVRVILVGRTGADVALRLDALYAVCRAHTPLEAMGEVAHPLGAAARTVVVLGSDVLENLRTGRDAMGPALGNEEEANPIADFVSSLRRLDESLLVLGVSGSNDRATAWFDGVMDPREAGECVRRALLSPARGHPATSPPVGDAEAGSGATPSGDAVGASGAEAAEVSTGENDGAEGDAALVALSVRGADVTERAVALIRARTGNASVRFVPADAPATPRGHSGQLEAVVAWDAHVFGRIVADASISTRNVADLVSHAAWLAGWLRLAAQQAQLRDAAFKDGLTGAWNRRYFDRFLGASIGQARAARRMLTVMVFDIDDFKQYNDLHGHDAGDEILVETVKLLRSVIRPTDRVCRIGGDEFAVIFDDPEGPRQEGSRHPVNVCEIAHRFQGQIATHRFPKLGVGAAGRLTVSAGLATYPWDGQTARELVCRADQLAMQSKKQGKNAMTLGPRE